MTSFRHLNDLNHLLKAASLGLMNEAHRSKLSEITKSLDQAYEHVRAARHYLTKARRQAKRKLL